MPQLVDANMVISALTNNGVTGLDALTAAKDAVGAFANQQKWRHHESMVGGAAAAAAIASQWSSLWQYQSVPMSEGAAPGAYATPSNSTTGGIKLNASGSRTQRVISSVGSLWDTGGCLLVYDRLLHMSGLDATLTTAQNVNGGAAATLSRYDGLVGNFLWFEIYTQIGATATTVTASYTNSGNVAGQITQPVVFGGTGRREAQRLIWASLAAGDKSIKAITSVTVLATTGTAGNFGVTVAHPLYMIPIGSANGSFAISFVDGPIPTILNGACVALAYLPNVASNPLAEVMIETEDFLT